MTTATLSDKTLTGHAQIEAVDLATVPAVCTDRRIPRKQQAALARKLLRSLGVAGISVTTPTYSMAQSVEVCVPRRGDYTVRHPDGGVDWQHDPAARANNAAVAKVEAILAKAFPNHDNRSDGMTDHFDYKWSMT